MVMKYYTLALLATLVAIAVVPFVAAEPPASVRMTESKTFEPKTITVQRGETVVWKNVSDMTHSVTDVPALAVTAADAALPQNAKEFNSGLIPPGKDYSYKFTVPGTYRYFCIPHEEAGMVGTVVVSK
jgi:plastocyanin